MTAPHSQGLAGTGNSRAGNVRIGRVRIGIVGPTDVVHRMMDVGHAFVLGDGPAMSLTGASYQKLSQIPSRVRAIVDDTDVLLFAGPLPYDVAEQAGVLTRKAAFVELSGSSLYGAMLRAARLPELDLTRVSIDSLGVDAIAEAYDECGLDRAKVRSRAYDGPESVAGLADFHRKLFERGRSTGALTTIDAVARELTTANVPVVRVRATGSALRASLRTAAFLGAGSVLEDAQVVIGLVEIPDMGRHVGTRGSGPWASQELRLEIARALRAETERAQISVMPRDDHSLALVGTLGSVTEITAQFSAAPFVNEVRRATGVTPYVGFGMGITGAAAEANAELALSDARTSAAEHVYVRLRDGSTMVMAVSDDRLGGAPARVDLKHADTVQTLLSGLADTATDAQVDAQVIDAQLAAEFLGTTARTARRVLQELAKEGLAWPLPSESSVTPGRPRQRYRLVAPRTRHAR
jgi:hypothetical protein